MRRTIRAGEVSSPHRHQLVPPRRWAAGELLPLHVPRPRAQPLGVTAAQAGLAIRASQAEAKARPSVPADFWPSYSAFANTDGGVIILGVRERDGKREIEGLADTEKIMADLWNAVNNPDKVSANVLFNESIYPVDVDGKAVVRRRSAAS